MPLRPAIANHSKYSGHRKGLLEGKAKLAEAEAGVQGRCPLPWPHVLGGGASD